LEDQKLKKAMLLTFSSLLISGAIVRTGKFMFGRVRPHRTSDQFDFHGPSFKHAAFPSGHSQTTFAIAATLATVYENKLVGILAFSVATLSSLSRIHDNAHWASDVFVGALIGGLTGHFIAKRHMKKKSTGVQLSPGTILLNNGSHGYGMSVRIPIAQGKKTKRP
jgi:membrane-associated phospholipid phosphatase